MRLRDAKRAGVTGTTISRLIDSGKLVQASRGVYMLPDFPFGEHHSLAVVTVMVDSSVICLLSALVFHEMTTQLPGRVWIAIRSGRVSPQFSYPPVEVTYMSAKTLEYGVSEHEVDKVAVSITTPAKTVADCFKYRSKVGIDVAIEALKDYWNLRKGTVGELLEAARICRVDNVLRPYLEAVQG